MTTTATPRTRSARSPRKAKDTSKGTPAVPITPQTATEIARATVVLEVRILQPSFRRSLRARDVMVEGDPTDASLLHVHKDLIDPAALDEINLHKSRFVRWLDTRSVACSMLRGGMRLIPLSLVEEVDEAVRTFRTERVALVATLVERYEEHKVAAKAGLGRHFNEADYPPAEALGAAFGVLARFLSLNIPAALEGLNRELYERERQRVEAEWTEAATEIRGALRESFAALVDRLADRLAVDDGKPRTFRDSTVNSLTDFLATFSARDLTGDADLAALAAKAKAVLAGVNPDDLRKDQDVRLRVRQGTEQILSTLATMEVQVKGRGFASDGEV